MKVPLKMRWLFSAGAVYLLLACLFLDRPGLQYDEVLFANAALGNLDNSFIAYQWILGETKIPLMLMPYIGAVKPLLYAPIFALFPISAVTVRLPVVITGLVTLAVTYLATKRVFNERSALLAVWLLATDPSYVFHVRLDWGPVALMLVLKMTSFYFLVKYVQSRHLAYLAAGTFAAGLGLYDKTNFIWYLVALFLAALITWPKKLPEFFNARSALVAIFFFVLGCWPLLLYNVVKDGQTVKGQLGLPEDPLRIAHYRARTAVVTLSGGAVYHVVNQKTIETFQSIGQDEWKGQPLIASAISALDLKGTLLPVGVLGAVVTFALLWITRRLHDGQAIAFLLIMTLLILAQTYISPNANGPHHMMMLYPFPQILLAHALFQLMYETPLSGHIRHGLRRVTIGVSAGSLVALVGSNLLVDAKYLASFAQVGGRGIWSHAIYDLAEYTKQRKDQTYLLMDWGFNTQLLLLSQGTVPKNEIFWSLLDSYREDELVDALHVWMLNPSSVFVFHAPPYVSFEQPRRVFESALAKHDLQAETIKVFTQGDGAPVYLLQKVSPTAASGQSLLDDCFVYREAEQWNDRSGGALDLKAGASGGAALGMFWGQYASDFVTYDVLVGGEGSESAQFVLRVAFEASGPRPYDVFLDQKRLQTVWLDPTGGWGYTSQEWRVTPVDVGEIKPGAYQVTIKPRQEASVINIDFLALCE